MKVKHLLGPIVVIIIILLGFLIYNFAIKTNSEQSLHYVFSITGGTKTQLKEPSYAIADENKVIFVADSGNHRVAVFNKSGHYLYSIGTENSAKHLSYPVSIGILDNRLLIGDVDEQSIFLYTKDGRFIRKWASVKGIKPFGIFIDQKMNVYVSDFLGKQVLVFSKNGSLIKKFKPQKVTIDTPAGLAIDSRENLWVADSGNYNVKLLDINGEVKNVFDGGPNKPLTMAKGLAIDERNRIYVADTLSGEIRIFDTFGNDLKSIGLSKEKDESLLYPVGISLNDGKVYIADQGSNKVQVWEWR